MTISRIIELLAAEYGVIERDVRLDPVSELVLTILSQNTSDINSRRAFANLTAAFGDWQAVARAEDEDIAGAIKAGGLAQVKAPRIKQVLRQILAERGSFDLGFLAGLPIPEAKAWLRRLPGVGPKTAGCVLLFSLARPVLPVDTHVYRVAVRLGLIDERVSPNRAHDILESMVPPDEVYQFHMRMVAHGRKVCRAQQPLHQKCVLLEICPAGQRQVGVAKSSVGSRQPSGRKTGDQKAED